MPEVTGEVRMDVEIWCDACGAGLCRTVSVKGTDIHVPPCAKCMEAYRADGYKDGHSNGLMDGRVEGRDEGRDEGYAAGFEEGLREEYHDC